MLMFSIVLPLKSLQTSLNPSSSYILKSAIFLHSPSKSISIQIHSPVFHPISRWNFFRCHFDNKLLQSRTHLDIAEISARSYQPFKQSLNKLFLRHRILHLLFFTSLSQYSFVSSSALKQPTVILSYHDGQSFKASPDRYQQSRKR